MARPTKADFSNFAEQLDAMTPEKLEKTGKIGKRKVGRPRKVPSSRATTTRILLDLYDVTRGKINREAARRKELRQSNWKIRDVVADAVDAYVKGE